MNVHSIANNIIKCIHPNNDFIIIRMTGFANQLGAIVYYYGDCELASGQMQTLSGDELALNNDVFQGEISRKLFISVKGAPLSVGRRDNQDGATFLYQLDAKKFWKVYNISEDFNACGWVQAFITLINTQDTPSAVKDALKNSGLITQDIGE